MIFTKVCVEFLTPNTRRRFNKPDIAGDKDSIATKAGCFAANCALTCSVVVNNGISNAAKISAVVTRPASCVTPCTSTGTPRRASNKASNLVNRFALNPHRQQNPAQLEIRYLPRQHRLVKGFRIFTGHTPCAIFAAANFFNKTCRRKWRQTSYRLMCHRYLSSSANTACHSCGVTGVIDKRLPFCSTSIVDNSGELRISVRLNNVVLRSALTSTIIQRGISGVDFGSK